MADKGEWAFPAELRPKPEEWRFDLDRALEAVVLVRAQAETLRRERFATWVWEVVGEERPPGVDASGPGADADTSTSRMRS